MLAKDFTVHFINISGIAFQKKKSDVDDVIANVVIYNVGHSDR